MTTTNYLTDLVTKYFSIVFFLWVVGNILLRLIIKKKRKKKRKKKKKRGGGIIMNVYYFIICIIFYLLTLGGLLGGNEILRSNCPEWLVPPPLTPEWAAAIDVVARWDEEEEDEEGPD